MPPVASLEDVQAVYSGAEGDLWELIMGHQIHIGGFKSSMALADAAGIQPGSEGLDLCCCNGSGMRFLIKIRGVQSMTGVDATLKVIERGKQRSHEDGVADRVRFVHGDVCQSGLPDNSVDFVWGEDAWCYVTDKARLIAEAARIVKPGGTIAFTDWIEGPRGLSSAERDRFNGFMKFPNVQSLDGYSRLLQSNGCALVSATDTGRFAEYVDFYMTMIDKQFTYDALRILNFDMQQLGAIAGEMSFLGDLARQGKIAQGQFIARAAV